jgi:hypothetical protein
MTLNVIVDTMATHIAFYTAFRFCDIGNAAALLFQGKSFHKSTP